VRRTASSSPLEELKRKRGKLKRMNNNKEMGEGGGKEKNEAYLASHKRVSQEALCVAEGGMGLAFPAREILKKEGTNRSSFVEKRAIRGEGKVCIVLRKDKRKWAGREKGRKTLVNAKEGAFLGKQKKKKDPKFRLRRRKQPAELRKEEEGEGDADGSKGHCRFLLITR